MARPSAAANYYAKPTAFTNVARRSSHQRPSFRHHHGPLQVQSTKPSNPFFDLMKDVAFGKKNAGGGDIESVQDFDAILASEIQDALFSAAEDEGIDSFIDAVVEETNGSIEEMSVEIAQPPIQIQDKATETVSKLPPHSALAKVLANQFGIDLASVSPSNGPGSKITAEDVEYHLLMIANGSIGEMTEEITQPPIQIQQKAPKVPSGPPQHSSLAQVLANEYGIDLASVSPAKGPGSKITAEDVEYHLLMISQGGATDGLTEDIVEETVQSPIQIQGKAPKSSSGLPPHTGLAQVLANQYGIDLASVSPAKGPGSKITAEDVELHSWMISQPPCTTEALELAHSLGLDLNSLYDDDDREYVMQLGDVELFQENAASLGMTSQLKKGKVYDNATESSRKKMKKISALDDRVEQNVGKLTEQAFKLAGSVTGGIFQQVQSQVQKIQPFEMDGKTADDINAVEDFDASLASEIEEALSCVNAIDEEDKSGKIVDEIAEVAEFETSLVREIQEVISSVDTINEKAKNDETTEDLKAVEDFGASIDIAIQEVLVSSADSLVDESEDATVEAPLAASFPKEELESLSDKAMKFAGTVTDGIFQQFQSQVQKIQPFDMNGKTADEINAVEDFDAGLASEIEEALSCVNAIDEEDKSGKIIDEIDAVAESDTSFLSEMQEALSLFDEESKNEDINVVEDFGASLDSEIQEVDAAAEAPFTKKELEFMTCVHLKHHLRLRGMKVSGKKAELVERLCNVNYTDDGSTAGDDCIDDGNESLPFFAALR